MAPTSTSPKTGQRATPSRKDERAPRRVPLDTILHGDQEIIIEHRRDEYRLRVTSNGKLLLTK